MGLTVLAILGMVVAVLLWPTLTSLWHSWTEPTTIVESGLPSNMAPAKTLDKVLQEAGARTRRHLDDADSDSDKQINLHLKQVNLFFASARQNVPHFANAALSSGSKRRLILDGLPFTSGKSHEQFLRGKFQEHVFGPDDLEKVIRQTVHSFLNELDSIDNQLLVKLQADLKELPTGIALNGLDKSKLDAAFKTALDQVRDRVGAGVRMDVATELASFIVGEVLAQVAARLGVSAGILGAGASTGWATLGVGVVVGIVVDQVLSWLWDRWADPVGTLAALLQRKLDDIEHLVMEGDGKHKGLRQHLQDCACARSQARRQAVLGLLGEMR